MHSLTSDAAGTHPEWQSKGKNVSNSQNNEHMT